MSQQAARVTAIVVTYNSAHVLPQCLSALKAQGVAAIVVDNASTDGTADLAVALGAQVIRNPINEGYGRANNIGIDAARTDFVLICNPDVTVHPGAIAALVDAADTLPKAGLIAPRIFERDGREWVRTSTFLRPGARMVRTDSGPIQHVIMLQGSCVMIRRDLFARIGGFDPNIFLFYEDDDLCRRLIDEGYDLVQVKAATVTHGLGDSTAPGPGHIFLVRYHQAWSKAYMARKYGLPSPIPEILIINGLKYLGAVLTRRKAKAERYGGSFGGAFDAWRNRRR